MKLSYFNTNSLQYVLPSKINIDELCFCITIKNTGNTLCLIDLEPLNPGESKTLGGFIGQVFHGRHEVSFTTVGMAVPPVTPNPSAWVTQSFYTGTPKGAKTEIL